jgi:two-component system, chemotaxis family, CheB/CheR fusion protein
MPDRPLPFSWREASLMRDSAPETPRLHGSGTEAESATLVGVGASAGGLKALQQFFGAVPANSGMAYVVILHLDPERESRMAELLQDRAAIPVTQVTGPTPVEVDHAYIIPPGQDVTVAGTTLDLRKRRGRSQHAPVDLFFRTLAEAYGARAMGVVLSGTGADGTVGIRHIREAGGVTFAQTPDEAEYGGMPESAVATGLIDRVLPVAEIPAELARLRRFPSLTEEGTSLPAGTGGGLAQVFATVQARTGHDFSQYKRSTVMRRLERRLRFNDMSTVQEYLPLLESSNAECRALVSDLLISVSSFFRDPVEFDSLARLVPGLFEGRAPTDVVRVWVVGCATGEEAYSVAMVLAEHASTLAAPPGIQVFATDIDERGYGLARAGLYAAADVAGITPERLERFFREEAGGYRVVKTLREIVLFAGHNVLQDPPFSRLDVISCRNLFIYLEEEAQARALEAFHFSLNPKGILFLGSAESVGDRGLFKPAVAGRHKLFRRNGVPPGLLARPLTADPQPARDLDDAVPRRGPAGEPVSSWQGFSYGALHMRMLEQYAPPSLIVNERLDVVHMSSSAGRFLRPGAGVPNPHVLGMAPAELRRALRTLLHHAFRDGARGTRRVRVMLDGAAQLLNVRVRPAPDERGAGRFALVVLELEGGGDAASEPGAGMDEGTPPGLATSAAAPAGAAADVALEEELVRTRDLLESTSLAHDITVAELQRVNEELQSTNEEQRAATEELETGREEIQAINEELITINQEHQSTIEELNRTNGDLQNLIESTEIATIFLDRAMRIRRFTPAAATIFNFLPGDQGRHFSHITHSLGYPGLIEDVARVLELLQPMEREVGGAGDAWYIVRINPYRSFDGGNEGVVLTFFNTSEQHRAGEDLGTAKLAAEAANIAKGNFLSTLSHEFRTPLNAIIGYADLLQLDGRLDGKQNEKVERIKVGGWHLVSMIEEILSFATLDAGHEAVESMKVDARLLAREAGSLTEPAADAKGLTFVLDLPDEPMPVITDPGKARQVLINLCGNAVKYTAAGEVRLGVRASGDRIAFDVSDTGVGIAPEHMEHIFERFWQVESGSTRRTDGLGLGLAAAREYARLLRGDIEVRSEPGRGSTFSLWLPVDYERR